MVKHFIKLNQISDALTAVTNIQNRKDRIEQFKLYATVFLQMEPQKTLQAMRSPALHDLKPELMIPYVQLIANSKQVGLKEYLIDHCINERNSHVKSVHMMAFAQLLKTDDRQGLF